MRGHIRKRGKNSWAVIISLGRDPDTGKRRRKWISVKGTRNDAERVRAQTVSDILSGRYVAPARITLGDYLDQWLRDHADIAVRPRTLDTYRTIVNRVKRELGAAPLAELRPLQVQHLYSRLLDEGLSPTTVRNYHGVLRQAFDKAVKWDMLGQNIFDRVTRPRAPRKTDLPCLDAAQVLRLITAAEGTDYHLPIHLALYTGLRRSEVLGLRWSDVDLEARTLTVNQTMVALTYKPVHIGEPKTVRSRRVVAVGEETVALLKPRRAAPEDQVCARSDGRTMPPYLLTKGFREIADACGIRERFHDLRHTHASLLLASGVPIHVVQARLGHSSIRTTIDVYGHVLPASDTEAGVTFEATIAAAR